MKIKQVCEKYNELFDKEVIVSGWVQTIRLQKELAFIKLNDGSCPSGVQLIVEGDNMTIANQLTTGSSIKAVGIVVKSPAEGQAFEIKVSNIHIYGLSNPDEYPLAKGKLPLDYLRNYAHLRTRTQTFGSIFRIKSAISNATHKFYQEKGYLHLNPNIITVNECEGGAGVFQITERDISVPSRLPLYEDKSNNKLTIITNNYDWNQDHFGKPAYLTVSSQLQLEALCCSLGSVYTTNKSFRSEHSSTNKHLSEFEHLEIEDAFIDINELMQIGEDYIKYVGNYLLENCLDDINNLGKFVSKGLLERIKSIVSTEFKRITYDEAIEILKKTTLSKPVIYGEDLCSEYENYLTDYFKGPVFVSHWPIAIKSFYMKQYNDNLCENFDLLMPYKVGELIGGSMREDNYDKIIEMMKIKGVSQEPLGFYLDLRKFGTVPHGGFGLGCSRLIMLFTGVENIKDVEAFPVFFKSCNY